MNRTDIDQSFSNVSSPGAPNVDSQFVVKHNVSAEIYQLFKDDVDALLLGEVSNAETPPLISQIINSALELYKALEEEKQYLLNDVLYKWAVKQQKVSIGTLWTQQLHYSALDNIHQQFEYFGELLEQTMSALRCLRERYFSDVFEGLYEKMHQLAHYFLYYSVIVARQPPSVVVKCGDAKKPRRSRFWFNTEIRVLGGGAFNIDRHNEGADIKCFLITEDTARQLLSNACHDVFENEEFVIDHPCTTFQRKDGHWLKAMFDNMLVARKDQLRRNDVATKRYCLCYTIHLEASHGLTLVGKKVSLPFAILMGPKTNVEARLFLERSFADLVRNPFSDIPESVFYSDMADALEMKFQAIVEKHQNSANGPALVPPRVFTDRDKEHIVVRLKPNPDGTINLERFLKQPVCEEYITKNASSDGEWKLVPFFYWFFKLAEIVDEYLYRMWNEGLIYGFCSKDEAEELLRQCSRATLLVRFSDVEFGKIKISVRYSNGVLHHLWYDYKDLNVRALQKELLANHVFADVEFIYPNVKLEVALGGRQKPCDNRKPRILNSTPAYFVNQFAGMSSC